GRTAAMYTISLPDALPISGVRGERISLDRTGTDLRQRIRRCVDHEVDLTGDQILHGGAEAAAIGDEPELGGGRLSEEQAADGRRSAEHTSELQSPYELVCR